MPNQNPRLRPAETGFRHDGVDTADRGGWLGVVPQLTLRENDIGDALFCQRLKVGGESLTGSSRKIRIGQKVAEPRVFCRARSDLPDRRSFSSLSWRLHA